MKYRRFLVFGYDNFYPCGGASDVVGSFDTLAEAQVKIASARSYPTPEGHIAIRDRYEILDLENREWVG